MRVSVATLTILVCLVDAKLKLSLLSMSINYTSSKYINNLKSNLSTDSVINVELDLVQNLTSLYVTIVYLIILFFYN